MSTQDCTCTACVGACHNQPGWFAPGEAEKAAAILGIPWDTFVRTHVVQDSCDDWYAADSPYVYAPRKVRVDSPDQLRRNFKTQRRQGTCVFLVENRCSIHEVKPFECRHAMGCNYTWAMSGLRDEVERQYRAAGYPLGMRPDPPEPEPDHDEGEP